MELSVFGLFTVLSGMAMDRGNSWTAVACLSVALLSLALAAIERFRSSRK